MQCTSTWFSVYRSVLSTVRETRAPMGTKAIPTVSLSTIMSVGIHNVDARLPWCHLDFTTSDRYGLGRVATETVLSSRGGCPPDLMNWWTLIRDERFFCVGGKGTEGETWRREEMRWFSRNIVMMILTSLKSPEERVSPRGAPQQMRKLDISCLCECGHSGFFCNSSGTKVSLLC